MLMFKHECIEGLVDLLPIDPSHIDFYEYRPTPTEANQDPTAKKLSAGHRNLLKWFIMWAASLKAKNDGNYLSYQQWKEVDPGDFNDFRLTTSNVATPTTRTRTGPTTLAAGPSSGRQHDAIADFKKSIKRDSSVYPVLKDQKYWNNWNRSVIAQARAHDISEVFDLKYEPDMDDDDAMELFEQKQSFAYSVLNKCVLTDQGKAFVREHEIDYDAQQVYRKLVAYAQNSTAAELAKDQLIEYLTTAKLDSRWRGSTEGFLLHWREQFRLLEDMLPTVQHYDQLVKKRMLESAVRSVPELQTVKDIDNNRVAAGGQALDYEQYSTLLMSAAVQRDDKLKLPLNRNKRVVQNAETMPSTDREEDWYQFGYVDAGDHYLAQGTDQQLSVHRMQQRTMQSRNNASREKTPFLPREIWEKLSDDAKLIIRGLDPSQPKNHRTVNLHDTYIAYPQEYEEDDAQADKSETADESALGETTQQEDHEDATSDDRATILAHITKRKAAPPKHDIRSVLATSHAPRTPSKPSTPNKATPTPKETIVLNGKRYVQADVHRLTYHVANNETTNSPKISSLVDRGANGGLAGSDVRLIETTSRFADVSGIDNHTLDSLPIATVAGVAQTHFGPVCLIMHQYAYHGKGKTIHSCVQIEHHGNDVNDKSIKVQGGKQRITTVDGYAIPI